MMPGKSRFCNRVRVVWTALPACALGKFGQVDVDHTSLAGGGDTKDADGDALRRPRLVDIEKGCCMDVMACE